MSDDGCVASRALSDEERARIIELIGEGKSRNEIAKAVGRSKGSVTNVAASIGHSFVKAGQTRLAAARETRSAYCAERRAAIGATTTEHIERVLREFFDKQPVVSVTKDGTEVVEVRPDARAMRDLASAVHTLTRTVLDIDRHDNRNDEGLAAVDAWLRDVAGAAS